MSGFEGKRIRRHAAAMLMLVCCASAAHSQGSAPNATVASPTAAPEHGEVTIKRDGYGVPHIYAASTYGLFYGFGYALAEDRLFQMEMLRRTAAGTVAEALGAKYLDHDRQVRGRYEPASLLRQYQTLAADERAIFDGYAAGYNARVRDVLAARATLLPREFVEFDIEPTQWTAIDVLTAYLHSMALRYSDHNLEVANLALLTQLQTRHGERIGRQIFDQVRWTQDRLAPTTVVEADLKRVAAAPVSAEHPWRPLAMSTQAIIEQERRQMTQLGGLGPDAVARASNVWVVRPERIASGETVLVNGPQMGDFSPGYIWGVGLHGAGFDLVGSGPLGSPWLIFGTNGRIGWGATAGMGDTVDTYQEQLHPEDAHRYLYRGEYRPMQKRVETIRVRGGEPVQHEVYSTVHGIVTQFDETQRVAYARKRSWEGTEVQSLLCWMRAMKASNFAEWRSAISGVSLSINNYYADTQGNIGYTFLGKFPRRPPGQDIRLPAAGTGDMEWQGYLPFESNPWVLNPRQGYIANWNNKPQPGYDSSDSRYWSVADHLDEIDDLLRVSRKLTTGEVWDVNRRLAFLDNSARYFLPLVAQESKTWPAGSPAGRAAALLAGWDRMTVDSATLESNGDAKTPPAYTLFRAFLSKLIEIGLSPHVPRHVYTQRPDAVDAPAAVSPSFPTMGTSILYSALLGAAAGVPQKFDFLAGKSREQVLRGALEAAVRELTGKYGETPASWSEPAAPHVFSALNYADIPNGLTRYELRLPAEMNRGTENNQIVLGAKGVSYCDVTPPGQSGLVWPDGSLSAHYADQLQMYGRFHCKQQWLRRADVDRAARSQVVLKF